MPHAGLGQILLRPGPHLRRACTPATISRIATRTSEARPAWQDAARTG